MSKKSKTLIITLGLLLLLGGGYYGATVYQRGKTVAASADYTPPPALGNLDSSAVESIEVPGLVLRRQDALWQVASLDGKTPPTPVALDQGRIQGMLYSLATVWAERVVDEEPEDLSAYGLDAPSSRTVVTDSAGNTAVYLVGSLTPFRTSYFVMQEGDARVFAVNSFTVDRLRFSLNDIRDRTLFPSAELQALTAMRIERPGTLIDIRPMPEDPPHHLLSTFSRLVMTSPYRLVRGVDSEALQKLLEPLPGRQIEDFVDDSPSSLRPYGLDNPVRLFLDFGGQSIDLLIGNPAGAGHYAKLAGAQAVFTVGALEPVASARPFALADKFALLVGIDLVERLSVTGGESAITALLQGENDDAVFSLNGRRVENRSFRNWYQTVIGLLFDAEIPESNFRPESPGTGEIVVEYLLRSGERVYITLVPYNRDFYALIQEGTTEFLIARTQVRRIFDTLTTLVYEE